MLKLSGLVIWRLSSRSVARKYSSAGATISKTEKLEVATDIDHVPNVSPAGGNNNTGLVAAAFNSLAWKDDSTDERKSSPKSIKQSRIQQIDAQIKNAEDLNSLLVVAENSVVSRSHAFRIVSILSEWSSTNKVKLADFEKDFRFLKLCRILARSNSTTALSSLATPEDLSTVLGITGVEEAARMITNLTLPQMIKVIKALQIKGRRSISLLRALSHNIAGQSDVIDLKKSADILYGMASLNFPDPVLLDRICNDVIECLSDFEDKPAVVNSITTSLGLMKYRHEPALNAIVKWMQTHNDVTRARDIASTIVTLGTVDYMPPSADSFIESALALKEEDMAKPSSWLDFVFALLTLNRASKHHLESTLRPEFIDRLLSVGDIPISLRRKLMLIDAYLQLTRPESIRLAEDISVGVPVVYSKEKLTYVNSIMDTFKSLVSAETFLKKECNSGMGFLYDAEFAVDSKCHPVPLKNAINNNSVHRIAVLSLDYHDMARKTPAPLGINQLYIRLLQLKGLKVLQIPYTEYNPKDKLVTRVQYIEKRIKELVSNS